MKIVPDSFQGGAMTLCRCWRIYRRDGQLVAFTDHDLDLTVHGQHHFSVQGLESSALEQAIGYSVTGAEATGLLSAPGLVEADIISGIYDGARVEIDLVDWTKPDAFVRIETGLIGEITRSGIGFTAEIRSLTTLLDEERGRLFQPACAAELGDRFCKLDLRDQRYRIDCQITATDGQSFVTIGSAVEPSLFSCGIIEFLSGSNQGDRIEIQSQSFLYETTQFILWRAPLNIFSVGDHVRLHAGCNKDFSTCRDVYSNTINFRGFPHLPGNDYVISFVADGTPGMDGGSLFA